MGKQEIPEAVRRRAKKFGGAEKSFRVYERKDQATYYDKGGHRLRSIANDERPNGHRKYWRNE